MQLYNSAQYGQQLATASTKLSTLNAILGEALCAKEEVFFTSILLIGITAPFLNLAGSKSQIIGSQCFQYYLVKNYTTFREARANEHGQE